MICKVNGFYAKFEKNIYRSLERRYTETHEKRREGYEMFRMWCKLWKNNHMLKDTVICNDAEDTRTHKVFDALEQTCYEFDLGKPIWLEKTIREFKLHDKARFYQDNFIEEIPFDYLEIQVIEED